MIENLRKQLEVKDKEIKTLKLKESQIVNNQTKNNKSSKQNIKTMKINEEFISGLKNMAFPENLSEFFGEIYNSSKEILANPNMKNSQDQYLRSWSTKFLEFYQNYL